MKNINHYSEEDFQNYFDKTFTGDIKSFEQHLEECEFCSDTFNSYSRVWSFAKKEMKSEKLRIDLASVVAVRIFEKKNRKSFLDQFLYGLLCCLAICCFYLIIKNLYATSISPVLVFLIIPLFLNFLMSYKEATILNRKYEGY